MIKNLFLLFHFFSLLMAADCGYRPTGRALSTCDCGNTSGDMIFLPSCGDTNVWYYEPTSRGLCCNIIMGVIFMPFCCEPAPPTTATSTKAAPSTVSTMTTPATKTPTPAMTTAAATVTTTKPLTAATATVTKPVTAATETDPASTIFESTLTPTLPDKMTTSDETISASAYPTLIDSKHDQKGSTDMETSFLFLLPTLAAETSNSAFFSSTKEPFTMLVIILMASFAFIITTGCVIAIIVLVLRCRRVPLKTIDVEKNITKNDVKQVAETRSTPRSVQEQSFRDAETRSSFREAASSKQYIDVIQNRNKTMNLRTEDCIDPRLPYTTLPVANFSPPPGYVFLPQVGQPTQLPTQHAYLNVLQIPVSKSHYATALPYDKFDYSRVSAGFVNIKDIEREYEQ